MIIEKPMVNTFDEAEEMARAAAVAAQRVLTAVEDSAASRSWESIDY